jgi:hypothetical protein
MTRNIWMLTIIFSIATSANSRSRKGYSSNRVTLNISLNFLNSKMSGVSEGWVLQKVSNIIVIAFYATRVWCSVKFNGKFINFMIL